MHKERKEMKKDFNMNAIIQTAALCHKYCHNEALVNTLPSVNIVI